MIGGSPPEGRHATFGLTAPSGALSGDLRCLCPAAVEAPQERIYVDGQGNVLETERPDVAPSGG